jgi:hypothetical protein
VADLMLSDITGKLGKYRMGKVCLYFNRLSDVDSKVLEQPVLGSVAEVNRRYG